MDRVAELRRVGKKLALAQARLDEVKEEAKEVAIAALAEGVMEITIAELLQRDRMTVRRWLGKRVVSEGRF